MSLDFFSAKLSAATAMESLWRCSRTGCAWREGVGDQARETAASIVGAGFQVLELAVHKLR